MSETLKFAGEDDYLRRKYREDTSDRSTGLDSASLHEKVDELIGKLEPVDNWRVVKARCFAFVCDEMAIDVSPLDWFPCISVWNRMKLPLAYFKGGRQGVVSAKYYPEERKMMDDYNARSLWTCWVDFDHSVPIWEDLVKDGFAGALAFVVKCDDGSDFYKSLKITAEACIRLVRRFASLADIRLGILKSEGADAKLLLRVEKERDALLHIAEAAPSTAYEVMLFIYLYFMMSEHLDMIQCRSLSIIDRTLNGYYEADVAAGRTTEAEFREQFKHFLWQWGSINNYWGQPVTLGGTKPDGSTEFNPLSMVILDVIDQCNLTSPKIHIKIGKSTPRDVFDKVLDMVRRHRSLTFIGEEPAWKILASRGYGIEEARGFYTKGCYEICVPNGANGTGTGYINLLKQVELVLADAAAGRFSASSYEEFCRECLRRMVSMCHDAMRCAIAFEKHLDDVNPANVATLGVRFAMRNGKDAFANGSERGNNTGIQISALGTTADAFVAVKELVFERGEFTLGELGKLMARNWDGAEELRLRMKRSKRKYGNNDPDANAAASMIQDAISPEVNGKPNSRGGFFMICGHSARAFIYQGEATGATPDGRKAGDQFSKNLSATMGADTEGATALIDTLASLDSTKWPGDFPLDVMLHPATVKGERGLDLMRSLVSVYFDHGGLQIQFNVVSAEELRDAQAHPENYENLQIRVCGWNVRWNDMPKSEQDEYILRAERIAE